MATEEFTTIIRDVAGVLGMNVGGRPLTQHDHGFWIAVALIASFNSLAAWIAFRRRDCISA